MGGCLVAKIVYVEPVQSLLPRDGNRLLQGLTATLISYHIHVYLLATEMITHTILRHIIFQTRTHEYILLGVGKFSDR